MKPDCAEALLDTAGDVFFYLAPFRYPETSCGLLFRRSLEEEHRAFGSATPFDSGGLIRHVIRLDPGEAPRDFLSRHELPIPDHRRYLKQSLGCLFAAPDHYLTGAPHPDAGPIGLTGGDERRWTHEVRIPDRVGVRTRHLQAVITIVNRSRTPSIKAFLTWCKREGVDYVPCRASHDGDWEALRQAGLDYIRGKLG